MPNNKFDRNITETLYDNLLRESEVVVIILRAIFISFVAVLYMIDVNLFPRSATNLILTAAIAVNIIIILLFYVLKNSFSRRFLTILLDFSLITLLIAYNFNVTISGMSIITMAYLIVIISSALWFALPGSLITSFMATTALLCIAFFKSSSPNGIDLYLLSDTVLFQGTFIFMIGLFAGYIVDIQIREREQTMRYGDLISKYENRYKNSSDLYAELLPQKTPDIPGYDVFARIRPVYNEGGGDIYYIDNGKNNDEIILAVADVSGKDARGVYKLPLFNLAVKTAFRLMNSFRESLNEINRMIIESFGDSGFVAASFVKVNGHKVEVSNCGNELPILIRANGHMEDIYTDDMLLGIDKNISYGSKEYHLEEGDTLIILTDGITEERNIDGEEFGSFRVKEILAAGVSKNCSSADLCNILFDAVDAFSANTVRRDDMTVLILRRTV